jgi:hypothetical protein
MITVPFSLLRAQSSPARGEQLNVGLVAFFDEGPKVYLDAPPWRLRSLHPDFEHFDAFTWTSELESALHSFDSPEQQHDWLCGGLGAVLADSELGVLRGESREHVERVINELLVQLVRAPAKSVSVHVQGAKAIPSRLSVQLKSWFKSAKLYSPRVSDLSKSRIVPSYPIDVSGDLYADFALKNGVVHIIETVDLRGLEKPTKASRGNVGFTAVLLDQAKKTLSKSSRVVAVTAADDYGAVGSLTAIIAKYADDVVVLESSTDRQRLADFISDALKVEGGMQPLAA